MENGDVYSVEKIVENQFRTCLYTVCNEVL